MECGVIVFSKSLPFFGKQKLKRHILVNLYVIVFRATASTAPLVMKGPTFCWALKESRKVVASQIVIFRSIQILNSFPGGSLKSSAYFSPLGIKKKTTNKNLASDETRRRSGFDCRLRCAAESRR